MRGKIESRCEVLLVPRAIEIAITRDQVNTLLAGKTTFLDFASRRVTISRDRSQSTSRRTASTNSCGGRSTVACSRASAAAFVG